MLCPGGLTATPVIGPTDTPGKYIAYAVSWDGRLRTLDVPTGRIGPPEPFLPPNGKPYGAEPGGTACIYTTTAQGCGGNPNAFYALRPGDEEGRQSCPGSGGMWPRTGPSVGKDGTVYAGAATATTTPSARSTARRSSA